MHLIDTNIIVRVLVNENTEQTKKAKEEIGKIMTGDEIGIIPSIIVAEVVYITSSSHPDLYGYTKKQVIDGLGIFFQLKNIQAEEETIINRSLHKRGNSALSFPDCYLLGKQAVQHSGSIISLDKKLLKHQNF